MKAASDFPLYYRERGNLQGLPIVLIHAFPMNQSMWEPQAKVLAEKFRLITYDIRGLGESELGDGQYTMELFVEDLVSILDLLKIPSAILVGLSLGGYIALRAVERFTERVRGLILCDTRSETDDNAGKLKRAQAIHTLQTEGVEAFAKTFIPSLLSEFTKKEKPEVEKRLKEMVLSQPVQGIVGAQLAMLSRTDTTESLGKISVPTLIIHGEQDPLIPLLQARAMSQRITRASLAAVPGAGHMSNLENPETFNQVLLEFLKNFREP